MARPQCRARQLFYGGGSTFAEIGEPYVQYSDYYFLDLKTIQALMDKFGNSVELAVDPKSERPT